MARGSRGWVTAVVGAIVLISAFVVWLFNSGPLTNSAQAAGVSQSSNPDARKPAYDDPRTVSDPERAAMLARAQVWREPKVPIARADFKADATAPRQLSCKFKISELGGTTPKFDCDLESGEEIRVKYGKGPEIPAEAAATRLLSALGFGADDITLIERLRCHGCPEEPFSTMRAVELTRAQPVYQRVIDYSEFEDFDWVAKERKFPGRPIETAKVEGWAFFELDQIDPAKGGAPRAQVDALRLMALFLSHWDNKSENQRLVCLDQVRRPPSPDPGVVGPGTAGTICEKPLAMIQDLGASFGPPKVNLARWRDLPVWYDRTTCTLSMRALPFEGATFEDVAVSEEGRVLAAQRLSAVTDEQIERLFAEARFPQFQAGTADERDLKVWTNAFKSRVMQIAAARCPF